MVQSSTAQPQQLLSLAEMKQNAERGVKESFESRLDPGDMVKIEGLQSATQLNGFFFRLLSFSPLAPCTLLCPDRSSGAAHIVAPKGLAPHRGNVATSGQTSERELKNYDRAQDHDRDSAVAVLTGDLACTDLETGWRPH